MKNRLIWLCFGMAFSITLALIVGQRLSAEAMAVVIGVIAGVAASIPTSLIVVWFTARNSLPQAVVDMTAPPRAAERAERAEPAEPRIVVVTQPQTGAAYPGFAGYGAHSYAGYAPAQAGPIYATPPALPARRFTVIGGGEYVADATDAALEEPAYFQETVPWQS
jgi:hypothetical protein